MAELVIEAQGLRKAYGETLAVQGVDLAVERGRVFDRSLSRSLQWRGGRFQQRRIQE
jgi:hypothetical protein